MTQDSASYTRRLNEAMPEASSIEDNAVDGVEDKSECSIYFATVPYLFPSKNEQYIYIQSYFCDFFEQLRNR